MNEKLVNAKNNIKNHFKENKKFYLGVGVGVGVAGITCLIMRKNPKLLGGFGSGLQGGPEGFGRIAVDNTARSSAINFLGKQEVTSHITHNAYTSIHHGGRGNMGFMTRHLDTGRVFQTQKEAAEAFGIPESILSSHLNGKIPSLIEGVFERVPA